MKILLSLLVLIQFSANANVQTEMRDVLKSYVRILPYTQIGKKLDDKKLVVYLDELKNSFNNTKNILHSKSPTFKSNITFINNNISHIKKGIELKHFDYTRIQIKNLVSNCISCHSQLPSKKYDKITHKYNNIVRNNLKSNFEKGMFAYFIRDYDKTIKYLSKDIHKIESAYKQEKRVSIILKVFTMNLKDHLSAKIFIHNLKQDKKIKISKDLLIKWETDLLEWSKNASLPVKQNLVKKLMTKFLDPIEDEIVLGNQFDNQVNLFTMQGVISNHLVNSPNSKLKARGLYWLGLIENSTPSLYSLGDIYLVDCIKSYPKSKYATKCFDSYKKSMVFGFTGSSGTHIPLDVENELNELKKLIRK